MTLPPHTPSQSPSQSLSLPPWPPQSPPLPARPRPLAELPAAAWAGLRGVLTDIDDTLTRDGAIEPQALAALHALHAAGVPVVAITGRPVGWSEPFVRAWPLDAIVAENGGVLLTRPAADPTARAAEATPVRRQFTVDAATLAARQQGLAACAAAIVAEVPGATLAQDSPGRLTDIAIDHSEFTQLPPAQIDAVVALMRRHGLTATVSSIHINGWIGAHDKFSGAAWAVRQLLGLAFEPAEWVYVGDSTNDQVMFERLPLTVGVANLMRFADRLRHWPTALTQAERGRGFAELVQTLLAARHG